MKLITSEEYSIVREELNEFVVLCNRKKYNPTKADFKDIIDFLLLYNGGDTTICESVLLNSLYEEFYSINESDYDPQKDFDSAVGMAGAVATGALALGAVGVYKAGQWIKFLYKRGKVKKSVMDEFKGEEEKIKEYELLNKLIEKKAKLEGKDTWTAEYPSLAKSDMS
jgi:hypothetical protein